jgi:two-component system nitrogen regulation response regulator GlnG
MATESGQILIVDDEEQLLVMMGPSEAIARVSADVARVACSNFTVVITGETGTGKALVARSIHHASTRTGEFVPVDCGAIPEPLFESALFGAHRPSKPGKFEIAAGGTLFFDEISSMPLGSQAKLLRALQERQIYRVGAVRPVSIDVRLLLASKQGLDTAVAKGSFRQDLFFCLNEFVIHLPPLRERKEDIVFLSHRFRALTNAELHKTVEGISDPAMKLLLSYEWQGNVRQLRSMIRRAVLLADTVIDTEHLPFDEIQRPVDDYLHTPVVTGQNLPLKDLVRHATSTVERAALIDALRRSGGNKAKAARFLQIDYKTMHTKLKEYRIEK